jgi:hypothetical protein
MSVIEVRKPAEVTVEVTRRDVLHRAADLIEEFGWRPGAGSFAWHLREKTCLLGAVSRARWDFGDVCPPNMSRYDFGFAPLSPAFANANFAFAWNDASGRTKAEVVALLRAEADA